MSKTIKNECLIKGVHYKCRICFDPGTAVYGLASEWRNSKTLRDLLYEVTRIKINDDELLPKTVCCKCLDKLISYYNFLIQIRNANKKYSQLLASGNKSLQNGILNKLDNITECLAESTITLPSDQYLSEIKFEEELVVPYDIVLSNSKVHDDALDPFKETSNEDIKTRFKEMQDEQRSLNEELHKITKSDYSDNKNETSSTSFNDDSNYLPEKRIKINRGNISKQFERKKDQRVVMDKISNRFMCPICKKTFSAIPSCRRHINTIHDRKTTYRNESSSSSSNESDNVLASSLTFDEKNLQKSLDYIPTERVNNRFVCPICKKTFTLQRNCRRHITTVHCQTNRFFCGFCGQHYSCKEYLTVHLKRMHPGESYDSNTKQIVLLFGDRLYSKPAPWHLVECKLCDTTFITSKELRQHLELHSDPTTLDGLELSRNIVQLWFSNVSDLHLIKEMIVKDIREKRWFKYYTVLNKYSYEMSISDTDAEDLEEESEERASKYHCELCVKEFPYKYQVYAHFKDDHIEEEIPLKCSRCKMEFISIKMYEQHRQIHCRNEYKVLRCAHCPGKFVKPESMKNHNCISKLQEKLETYNDNKTVPSKTIIRCGLCKLSFEKLRDLRKHISLHADGKTGIEFKSCIYLQQFKSAQSIDYEVLQQQIKHAFLKCQISHLYQAIDKHGNEMDISDSDSDSCPEVADGFKCELCKEMFRRRKLLLNHQQERHSDVPMPFTCKDCKQQYISIHLLQQHLKRECWNEQRRIAPKCNYCNKRIIWPDVMLKHKEIQHQSAIESPLSSGIIRAQTKDVNSATVISNDSSISEKGLPTTAKLEQHSTDVQAYYCFLCPNNFISMDHLIDHLRHHKLKTSDIKAVESIIYSTCWPNGKKIINCKTCGHLFKNMAMLNAHFTSKNPENLCNNQHSLANYSITNQKGFELHLELDSETENENDIETEGNDESYSYNCCLCNMSFKRKYQIAQHQRSMHNYNTLELKCELCVFRTVSQKVLDYHKVTQCFNVEKKFRCDQCNFKFMWLENLDGHISRCHTQKSITTAMCAMGQTSNKINSNIEYIETKDVNNDDLIATSETSKTKNKILCPICGASSTTSSNLAVHIMRHNGEKPFKCNICEMAFPRKADLQEHTSKHTDERPFKCKICEKSFKSQRILRAHKRLHTGERPYQCTICQKSFIKSGYLKLHMLGHSGEKPYTCNICGKGYICASSLRKHRDLKGHNELWSTPDQNCNSNDSQQATTKKSLCPICGVCLSSRTSLTYHMRTHTGEKPYKCNLCEMTCTRSYDLEMHRRTHFADRPFKCKFCEKSFRDQYRLKIHIRIHTGERPYQCNICQKKFAKPSYLKVHLLNHTGEKPFRCEICDQAFICVAYLKKHRIKKGHHVENN